MFYLLIARIKAMFDDNMISIREEMFSIFKRGYLVLDNKSLARINAM